MLLGLCQPERAALPSRTVVTSGPKLLLRALSGSMVLLQLGSMLMSMTHITTEAHVNHVLNCPSLTLGKLPHSTPES